MIKTRHEACSALGISDNADTAQIKSAYKRLVKKYHPDSTGSADATIYNTITEAYQFLMSEVHGKVLTHTKVVGKSQRRNTASNAEYTAFQKKAARQKKRRAQEFEEKQKEYTAKLKKQEDDYRRAMEAIDAIRAARAIQAMIWANSLGKDNDNNKE